MIIRTCIFSLGTVSMLLTASVACAETSKKVQDEQFFDNSSEHLVHLKSSALDEARNEGRRKKINTPLLNAVLPKERAISLLEDMDIPLETLAEMIGDNPAIVREAREKLVELKTDPYSLREGIALGLLLRTIYGATGRGKSETAARLRVLTQRWEGHISALADIYEFKFIESISDSDALKDKRNLTTEELKQSAKRER